MATAEMKVTLCVEDDIVKGDDVLHVIPTWQNHEAIHTCRCKPEVIVKSPVVIVYWHNWKEPADAND